eukprot:1160119-Pelagomonas_calceolata.AAC.8
MSAGGRQLRCSNLSSGDCPSDFTGSQLEVSTVHWGDDMQHTLNWEHVISPGTVLQQQHLGARNAGRQPVSAVSATCLDRLSHAALSPGGVRVANPLLHACLLACTSSLPWHACSAACLLAPAYYAEANHNANFGAFQSALAAIADAVPSQAEHVVELHAVTHGMWDASIIDVCMMYYVSLQVSLLVTHDMLDVRTELKLSTFQHKCGGAER